MLHPGPQRDRFAECVAVEFVFFWPAEPSHKARTLEVPQRAHLFGQAHQLSSDRAASQHAVLPDDLHPDLHPADHALGAQGDDVENPVVHCGIRKQQDVSRQGTTIADQNGVGSHRVHRGAVDAEAHSHPTIPAQ